MSSDTNSYKSKDMMQDRHQTGSRNPEDTQTSDNKLQPETLKEGTRSNQVITTIPNQQDRRHVQQETRAPPRLSPGLTFNCRNSPYYRVQLGKMFTCDSRGRYDIDAYSRALALHHELYDVLQEWNESQLQHQSAITATPNQAKVREDEIKTNITTESSKASSRKHRIHHSKKRARHARKIDSGLDSCSEEHQSPEDMISNGGSVSGCMNEDLAHELERGQMEMEKEKVKLELKQMEIDKERVELELKQLQLKRTVISHISLSPKTK